MTDGTSETVTIGPDEAGLRLDRVLAARIPALSRSRLKALILGGQVMAAGKTIRDPAQSVNSGDVVSVTLPPPEPAEPQGEDIPLQILHEDDALIVLDKPAGLVVHPAAGHAKGTLVNALIAHCGDSLSGIGGVKRPGIVHRLDKDTSGVMVVAKTDAAHRALSRQFENKAQGPLERGYLAYVQFKPSFAHRPAHIAAYMTAVEATFATIAEAMRSGDCASRLKGPCARRGFYRLTT